jgi:hypothetical protein
MKKYLLVLLVLFTACSKDDITEELLIQSLIEETELVDTDGDGIGDNLDLGSNGNGINDDIKYIPGIKQKYELYQESVLNQRSGIAFTWHDQKNLYEYTTSVNTNGGWFNAYQSYHDVNQDGFMDILVSYHINEDNVGLYWFVNSGDDKNFNKSTEYINQGTQGMSAHKLLKTDVNNDGIVDFIALGVDERVMGDFSGNFTVLIGKDDGTFNVNNLDNSEKLWFHNGASGDLNGDGNVDVIAATYLWWGDGKGNFTKGNSVDMNGLRYTESPLVYEIIDMNNDGWNDLILRGPFENTKVVLNNNGTFNESNQIITLPEATYDAVMDIEIVDFDNDGDYDIIELAQLGGNPPDSFDAKYFVSNLLVYYNNNLNFELDESILSDSIDGNYKNGQYDKYGWSVFKFDDIDGDGQDEIIAENYHDSNFNAMKLINGEWKKTTIKFGN